MNELMIKTNWEETVCKINNDTFVVSASEYHSFKQELYDLIEKYRI